MTMPDPAAPDGAPVAGGVLLNGQGLRPLGVVCLGSLLAMWLAMFAAGTAVDTLPYRYVISPLATVQETVSLDENRMAAFETMRQDPPARSTAWLVFIIAGTATNVAFLSIIAGMAGALGSHARLSPSTSERDSVNVLVSGAVRGFVVYLVVISSVLILMESPFQARSPDQYLRIAGFVSITSFLASMNPALFRRLTVMAAKRIKQLEEATERELGEEARREEIREGPLPAAAAPDQAGRLHSTVEVLRADRVDEVEPPLPGQERH